MNIKYEIIEIPNSNQKTYLVAYLEGTMKIFIEDVLFFNQSNILLLEFAVTINSWLRDVKSGKDTDFIYETMDHEEPIITIKQVQREEYEIDSIWKEENVEKTIISKSEVVISFQNYLEELNKTIKTKINIELKDIPNW